MKIVIAPNALKDCLSTTEAADAIEKGVLKAFPNAETIKVPVADGGDGLLDTLLTPLNGVNKTVEVTGPLYKKINADFVYFPKQNTALIEMAKASGLALLPVSERDVMKTTSLGTGELIKSALDLKVSRILVGIGGSATCDGGMGLATALGVQFLDSNNIPLIPIGANLVNINIIDISKVDPRLAETEIEVICDVDNPLYGINGAAYVYGPQKGASKEQVQILDEGLVNLSKVIKRDIGKDVSSVAGGGAAGGIGAGLSAYFDAILRPGIDVVLDLVNLKDKILNADLVLTAEGQMDNQTAYGKAPAGVAKCAKKKNIPCIAIAGSITDDIDQLHQIGITALFSLCPGPITLDDAIKNGAHYISNISEQIVRAFFASE